MLRSNEVSPVVRVCREDSPPGNESDRIVWREDSYILLQCPSREDPGDCNITGQKISRLDLEKYNKVKLLQGSDDQTDKNVIPFTNAAQNAPLLQEPLYCTNTTEVLGITNDFLYPRWVIVKYTVKKPSI